MSLGRIISHLEIGAADADQAGAFFAKVLGWSYVRAKTETEQTRFDTPGGRVGLHGGNSGFGMLPYLMVQDIDSAVERVREAGGQAGNIIAEEGWGRFCNCSDPGGVRFGLHQPS
ncbi:MAG: VOC family protein [Pseudomonadota bacterium]